jgi:septum site-determining protein MinD
MGEVIVITSGKGGVGKTTVTANIGAALASMGHKTVLIDTDIGLRNLDIVMGLENRVVYNLVDVVEDKCRLKQAIIKDKRNDNLYMIPAAQTREKTAVKPEQMSMLCRELASAYDYVIIDCPAGIEQGFKNAIAGADKAIVVASPEVSSVRDADRIIGLLEAYEMGDISLIINKVRQDMIKKGRMMSVEDITEILAIRLIGVITDSEEIVISTNRGEPIAFNRKTASGRCFYNIARIITGEEIPIFAENVPKNSFLFARRREG